MRMTPSASIIGIGVKRDLCVPNTSSALMRAQNCLYTDAMIALLWLVLAIPIRAGAVYA